MIVVDQEATQRARDLVEGSGLPSVRYLVQPRLGLSASRNLALMSAIGQVLAVTDDDCAPEPSWLTAVEGGLERPPRPGAVTGRILPLGDPVPGTYAVSLRVSESGADHAGRVHPWDVGSGGDFAAPVEVLRAIGGWDERLGAGSKGQAAEDADLLRRLLRDGAVVRYEPAAVVRHERQPWPRRFASRWAYGYGVGAMCALWLARGDLYAMPVLYRYWRLRAGPLLRALWRRDLRRASDLARGLAGVAPGLVHGFRVSRRPSSSIGVRPR